MDELIKAALTVAGAKALEVGADFLKRIVGPKADDLGKDWAARKTERILTVASKANEMVMDLPLQQPPDRVLVPILNGAGNEDDADLQAKWAALLAHSATKPDSVLPAYPKILSELSPLEAKILDWLFENSEFRATLDPPHALRTKVHISLETLVSHFSFTDSDSALTLCANLQRLGLIQMPYTAGQAADVEMKFIHIVITPFALHFVMACGSHDVSKKI